MDIDLPTIIANILVFVITGLLTFLAYSVKTLITKLELALSEIALLKVEINHQNVMAARAQTDLAERITRIENKCLYGPSISKCGIHQQS